MAAFALTDPVITFGGTNISSYVKSVTVSVEANELDISNFTSAGWTQVAAGMKSGSMQITVNDSMTVSEIDQILWTALWTSVAVTIKAQNSAVTTSNPLYSGSVLVKEWNFGGGVGDLAEKSVTYPLNGALTRATA